LVAVLLGLRGLALAQDAETVTLIPMHWDDEYQRWRDIASNPYARKKKHPKRGYNYGQASVTLTYRQDNAGTFTGTLVATGLKPNFAYQIKLNGKPTSSWGADGDDWANEQLGNFGRWWGDEGYIMFDYFVTDSQGNATVALSLDSSFHVLWKTSQSMPPGVYSEPTTHLVEAYATSEWYDVDYGTETVQIVAECEHSDLPPDAVQLPDGPYNVRIFLAEESFHEEGAGSGSWATVMGHDYIRFGINCEAPEPPPPPPIDVSLVSVVARDARTGGRYNITATVANNDPLASATVSVDCLVSGPSEQALRRKTVTVAPGREARVKWNDSVGVTSGIYTATVTVAETAESLASNSFEVK